MGLKGLIIGMLKTIKTNVYFFKLILLLCSGFLSFPVISQVKNSSFSYFFQNNEVKHASIKPFLESHQFEINPDSVSERSWLARKWFDESLFNFHDEDINLIIDPLFNFSVGVSPQSDGLIYSNVRGIRIAGDITSKVSFETRIYENQFIYPDFLSVKSIQRANSENTIDAIAFGIGRAKKFKENGLDASLANGYLSFSPTNNTNFQIGHGRHFFGSGYRSLLISDYAPDYPYLSGQYYFFKNKFLYKHVTAWMSNLSRIPASSTVESLFVPKFANFNQISFQPNQKWSFALFEGAIYKSFDNQKGRINPKTSFYIPILGLSMADKDESSNLIYGFDWSFKMFKNWKIYNQFSSKHLNKIGMQFGLKNEKPFNLNRSFVNFEYNSIPSAFYSIDSSNILQRYSHLAHELAHPLGSGLREVLLKGQFSLNYLFFRFSYNYLEIEKINNIPFASQVITSNEQLGFQNIDQQKLIFLNSSIGIYFNRTTNMEVSLGHLTRFLNKKIENYLMVSWRTYLKNDYYDQ